MKIRFIEELEIPGVKVIGYDRFCDHRGYFCETLRETPETVEILDGQYIWRQHNESFSRAGVVRGLHFQWDPYMGKLVRVIHGHMIDLFLDIRVGSPTFGKASGYQMSAQPESVFNTWIWLPPGIAHGNVFLADTTIEYLCTGRYNPECEAGISPFSEDIDWSLLVAPNEIRSLLTDAWRHGLVSRKDQEAMGVFDWAKSTNSAKFVYKEGGGK